MQKLAGELYEALQKVGLQKAYAENEVIFTEGEPATFLPLVRSGSVKLVRYPEPSKEIIIGFFAAGEIFAIAPALDGKRFPATAVALEPTSLLLLPRPAFLALMKESEEFSAFLLNRMCGLLRDRTATAQILATASAEKRVGSVLLRLAQGCHAAYPLAIPFRRLEIAEMSGLTLETTIRAVRKLEKGGYLKLVNHKIILENPAPLKKLVQA